MTNIIQDKMYKKMVLRRKFYKRVFLMTVVFLISFYVSSILFGDIKVPLVMRLTDLNRCPACYGVSVCPELYSNQITLDNSHRWARLFNAKNIYYGSTKSNRRVVLKKLAHDSELHDFDSKLCKTWKLKRNCKPIDLLNVTDVDKKFVELVQYNLSSPNKEPVKGLVVCPYGYSIYDFIQPVLNNMKNHHPRNSDLINVWTLLNINPEPIILQVIPKSQGWPVPPFGGVCGRIEVVGHEGESLDSMRNVEWHRKLKFSLKILEAALDFTLKHERYSFYLMDWSVDNIVVNSRDELSFVDLEDVIVIDKHITPGADLPNWYQRDIRDSRHSDYSFSIEKICKHHLSDHNLWAACYLLAHDHDPFLYPIPKEAMQEWPHLDKLLQSCLTTDDRFRTVTLLQQNIHEILNDEKTATFGVVR